MGLYTCPYTGMYILSKIRKKLIQIYWTVLVLCKYQSRTDLHEYSTLSPNGETNELANNHYLLQSTLISHISIIQPRTELVLWI
jgi:hypothetical protein